MSESLQNLGDLTSPEDFINYYYPQIKDRLQSRGLQISKVGFIGFFIHLFANTQFDVKQYYDTLFREAFLAVADQDENLNLHGTIFGYNPMIANAATLTGSLKVNKLNLPPTANPSGREIIISGLTFKLNALEYTMESIYTITNQSCQITKSSGEVVYVPYSETDQTVPINDIYQYSSLNIEFSIPFYSEGTYFQKIIDLEQDGTVYEIKVDAKLSNSDEFVSFDVRNIKYFTLASEDVIFVRYLPNNKLLLEFGSGIHGKYIPESQIKLKLKITKGTEGNISSNTLTPITGLAKIFDTETEGTAFFSADPASFISMNVDYGDSGTDILTGEDLRNDIIKFVQTRESMMSETDFYNILEDYVTDMLLMFKKTHPIDNTIYAFILLKDKYLLPISSKSISVLHSDFNPINSSTVYKPIIIQDSLDGEKEYISPFLYILDSLMRDYKGYIYKETYSTYFKIIDVIVGTDVVLPDGVSASPVPLSLHFQYRADINSTRITIQSYQDVSNIVCHLKIPILNVNACMSLYDDNIHEYYHTSECTIIDVCMDIKAELFSSGIHLFNYSIDNVCLMEDITDILTLKQYECPTTEWDLCNGEGPFNPITGMAAESYILNIPVMLMSQYIKDPLIYEEKFRNTFGKLSIKENRMISDDVQVRFLNTEIIRSNITQSTTIQSHNIELHLPLKLKVLVVMYKSKTSEINSITVEDDIKVNLATKLYDTYTGLQVSFYKTQIIDIIHDFPYIKYCDVHIYDSLNQELMDANIEVFDQRQIVSEFNKLDSVTYCPFYIWWDLDNIEVTISFE